MLTEFDFDPFEARAAVPNDLYREMRATCPVARIPIGWVLTRQADVLAATRDVETFQASFREPGVVVPEEEKFINEIAEPRHGRIRRVINAAVAHHRAMQVESFVRELCHEYLAPVVERGHGDLIAEYVAPVPVNVIAHLIGVPRADWPLFRQWSDDVVHGTYPTQYRNDRGEGLAGAHPEFTAYIDELVADRASGSGPDDLVTRLLATEVDGQRLTPVEVRTQLVFLIISGNETTRHLIANLLASVVESPALFGRLDSDRSLVERAVEESLRIDPPIQTLLRNVERPTACFGPAMAPPEKIVYAIASANRDETVFDTPDEFSLERTNFRDHVAFGGGPHVCPGASLARLEARIALEVFLDRVGTAKPALRWARTRTPVFWANGPTDLLVEVVARR